MFGASDGLVSNFALIAGVTGGTDDSKAVLLAGLAGLAAGAFSMAAGEYISVRSQAEQALAEIELERRELERNPAGEERELAQMYVAKGLEPDLAREVARQLSRDPDRVLDVHVREELGISRDDLPSATLAAGSSFVSFAVGRRCCRCCRTSRRDRLVLPALRPHPGRALPLRRVRHAPDAAALVVRRPAPDAGRRRGRGRDLRRRLAGRRLRPRPDLIRSALRAARSFTCRKHVPLSGPASWLC